MFVFRNKRKLDNSKGGKKKFFFLFKESLVKYFVNQNKTMIVSTLEFKFSRLLHFSLIKTNVLLWNSIPSYGDNFLKTTKKFMEFENMKLM